MFYLDSNQYLYSETDKIAVSDFNVLKNNPKKSVLHLPLIVDTEYQTFTKKYSERLQKLGLGSLTISLQIKGLDGSPSAIYCDDDLTKAGQDIPLHFPLWKGESLFVQYLTDNGYSVSLTRCKSKDELSYKKVLAKSRVLRVVFYAHFAIADFYRVFKGVFRDDMLALSRKKPKSSGSVIDAKRRFLTQHKTSFKGKKHTESVVKTNYIVKINGIEFSLEIACVDSSALHGIASYKSLAENTATVLDSKDLLTGEEKSDMLAVYLNKPDDFREYAMGDLAVYDILKNNSELMKQVYQGLGLGAYFTLPKLTIGSTVAGLLTSAIARQFQTSESEPLDAKEIRHIVETYCKGASAKELVKCNSLAGLNAKVLGGRCFNNRPTHTTENGMLADIDISGAYATAMVNSDYALGNPVKFGEAYKINGQNKYLTLREFLKEYRKKLVPGLYQIWFSVDNLPTGQDFFNSYFPPKNWQLLLDECEGEGDDTFLDRIDFNKILSHEITNGLINCDGLEWLEKVASRKLKNYILDNSQVKTALFYDADFEVKSISELIELTAKHHGMNESYYKDGVTYDINRECKYWYRINLGELLINALLKNRKHWKNVTSGYKELKRVNGNFNQLSENALAVVNRAIEIGGYQETETFKQHALTRSKHPLDTLYKLCCNTVYGDVVSKYFDVSNVIVGNNITAKVRACVWYAEKGLYTHGSITDGGAFNLNTVCFPKSANRRLSDNTTGIYSLTARELDREKYLQLKPLGGFESIEWEGEQVRFKLETGESELLTISEAIAKIDVLAYEHLKNLFPVSTVEIFKYESKGLINFAVFHGASNYGFFGGYHESYGEEKSAFKMRSYSEKTGLAKRFLSELRENHKLVKRDCIFEKEQILKVGTYRTQYNSHFKNSVFLPGESYLIVGLFREFSLSQFTFKTFEQYNSWESEVTRLKRKYAQSYEMFFTSNGRLEYQRMILEVDNAIQNGFNSFLDYVDKHYNLDRFSHPENDLYLSEKQRLYALGLKPENEIVVYDDFTVLLDDDGEIYFDVDAYNAEYYALTAKGNELTEDDEIALLECLDGLDF